ncbi:phytoene desaturase family protein [Butyrivibrio sp. MC2021]|uniref:phytoene desaturase family protein n=1 Tax=Butyrivibrio sp. MC2021 TaxID=1408306 RepID=UPI0004787FC4|nr:NAD(P)/FAD-dependent oxidoreductase [Butyrivibrio sp. MC2021]
MKKFNKVVIIGGGVAGLSAGIYARIAGLEAEIYEKNSIPGGECIGWNRGGYHIDNCIHWLTGTRKGTELYDVWKTVGGLSDDTQYADLDSFYTSCVDGQRATLYKDLERTRSELTAISPEDKEEIDKFIQYVEDSKSCLMPADKPMDMFTVGDYIRLGKSMGEFMNVMKELSKVSIEEYSRRFKSPVLRQLMCDYLPKDYTAYSLLVSYASIADENGNIPMGGSLQLSLRMEKRFKELGGKIFYNSAVKEIVVKNKKAQSMILENGTVVTGDYFIATLDTSFLFGKLLDESYMPKAFKKAYEEPSKYPGTSGFQVAFSVNKDFNPGETVFINIDPIKVGANTFSRMYVKVYGYDKTFVKGDRQVLQSNFCQQDDDYFAWKAMSPAEYKETKERLARAVKERIESFFPEVKGDLEILDTWSPLTYERYCNAYHGSYMSFVTTPYGPQVREKGTVKGIKNLCFAGQWNSSPGGLPVAVTNGKFAIQRICHKKSLSLGGEYDERRTEGRAKTGNTYDGLEAVRGKRVS